MRSYVSLDLGETITTNITNQIKQILCMRLKFYSLIWSVSDYNLLTCSILLINQTDQCWRVIPEHYNLFGWGEGCWLISELEEMAMPSNGRVSLCLSDGAWKELAHRLVISKVAKPLLQSATDRPQKFDVGP